MGARKKLGWLLSISLSLVLLSLWQPSEAKRRAQDWDLKKREEMVKMSRELGVTCTHCHDVGNFTSGKKKTYQTALKHIRITANLNGKNGFNGRPKVTCYLCHRGKVKPDYIEPKLK